MRDSPRVYLIESLRESTELSVVIATTQFTMCLDRDIFFMNRIDLEIVSNC